MTALIALAILAPALVVLGFIFGHRAGEHTIPIIGERDIVYVSTDQRLTVAQRDLVVHQLRQARESGDFALLEGFHIEAVERRPEIAMEGEDDGQH